MPPCKKFRKSLFKFIDDELDVLQKKLVEQHLKECLNCKGFLNQIRSMQSRIKNLSNIQASENFHILLRERIRREMAGKREFVPRTYGFSLRWIPAAGLVVLMVISGFWMIDKKTTVLNKSIIAEATKPSPVSSSGSQFNGQVDYVIDDYPAPSSVSISRDDRKPSSAAVDTVYLPQENNGVQAFLTPVDF
jgi:anti-sigma factor RsiW